MKRPGKTINTLVVVMIGLGAGYASAQSFPYKPVRVLSGVAGGSGDISSRVIATPMSEVLGQPFIVENRSGVLSADVASKATPDGYTLLAAGNSIWIQPLFQKVPYDMKDLAPITILNRNVLVLAVNPNLPVQSVKELIALAKAKPGQLNVSHSGAGGPAHLAAELFKSMAGVNIVSVPYKGGAPALTAVMSGEVQMLINTAPQLMPQVKTGKIRGLAVTSSTPSVLAPGLPTIAASGVPGYEAIGVTAAFVTVKTPKAIIDKLNQALVRVVNQSQVKEQYIAVGSEAVGNSVAEATAYIKSDTTTVAKLIKDANLPTEK